MSDKIDKGTAKKAAGPAFFVLGIVFMTTTNVALGAAFIAIGAALTAKQKGSNDAR